MGCGRIDYQSKYLTDVCLQSRPNLRVFEVDVVAHVIRVRSLSLVLHSPDPWLIFASRFLVLLEYMYGDPGYVRFSFLVPGSEVLTI